MSKESDRCTKISIQIINVGVETMLFAILDYLRYRRRKGIYSDAKLQKQGGRLAIAENFPDVASFDPGYLFFCHTRYSVLSWLVMYYTSFPWSHTGSFSERGRIIDVTTTGVIEHSLSDYFDGRSFIAIRGLKEEVFSDEQKAAMLKWLRDRVGHKYAWSKVLTFFWKIISGSTNYTGYAFH
jgi:hypothetical protein